MKSFSLLQRLKACVPDVLAILFFVAVSCAYFAVPLRDGLVLSGHDHTAAVGSGAETQAYERAHGGERTRWTNTIFSGMPTYQMCPSYPSTDALGRVQQAYRLWLPTVASYIFMMLLGFYILLRCFNFRVWMSALGAVLWAFSSYYFIIIAAGHIWKLYTLCYIPPTIAGMVLCYRGKYLPGIAVTGLFTAMQIVSNHVQMTYYFLFVIGFMVLAFLIDAVRQKRMARWLRASACFALGGIMGICINLSNLFHTWQYSKESMRGKTELTQRTKDAADQTSSGLERSYITAWSYGIDETWTLLVPNTKGGASMPLTYSKTAMKKADPQYAQLYQQLGQYWGDQPGTSGPVYVGAFVLMLFVLGLFIVKGPMKWCLLAATVLSILLSWGKNFMGFTDFFLDYVPMYDKFRTVASILVIAEFTIPLLAMLALKKLVDEPQCLAGKDGSMPRVHYLTLSFALTGGVALLFWLIPDVFFGNYISQQEHHALSSLAQYGWPQSEINALFANLNDMRRAVFTADALRSFFVVAIGTLMLLVWRWGKLKTTPMVAGLIVLCLVDMWGVNKRYLNDGMFVRPRSAEQMIPKTPADEVILQDEDLYYRVLDMTCSTFNDNTAAYYHKSIGGYHAAKLRRYQELIEAHIAPEMRQAQNAVVETVGQLEQCNGDSLYPVLNMLNMKYLIMSGKDGEKLPVLNPWANGNAWFLSSLRYVDTADDELAALSSLNTKRDAVSDVMFRNVLGEVDVPDSAAVVTLTEYEANRLAYEVESKTGGVVAFSEIYYPGWTCTVDGEPVELGRVNYVLRAARIPAGKHQIVLSFDPQTVHTTEAVANISLALLCFVMLFWLLLPLARSLYDKSREGKQTI